MLLLSSLHTPAVIRLIHHAGDKGVNFAKVIVDAPIVARNRHIPLPDGSAGKMARTLAECVCVRPLIHLDGQAEGGDFQRTEVGRPNSPASGPSK